jgi:histidinol-phosphate aminotransferase
MRPDVGSLPPYEAGLPLEEVARRQGIDPSGLAKLASNECPEGPFPEVVEAIAAAAATINRYPDNSWYQLAEAVASELGVSPDQLMFGGGSSELIRVVALAVGGEGTTAVYSWPSFVIYRMATILSGAAPVEVPLAAYCQDPDAILGAVRPDTTVIYLCNPNNPTGTYLPLSGVQQVIEEAPEDVLVVVDEAYYEYVTASDYATAIPQALSRPNVVVLRTFSKIYSLAALRVGFAVGQAATLTALRRAQAPFTVGTIGQAAAITALRYPERVADRSHRNAQQRDRLLTELAARGVEAVPSHANFVYLRREGCGFDDFLSRGIIVRAMAEGWIRVTVGTPEENTRFLSALEALTLAAAR